MSENYIGANFSEKLAYHKEEIYKKAADKTYYDFDSNGKIQAIEDACKCPIMKKVCYMIATSHEYKKPNTKNSIAFVKNYAWSEDTKKVNRLQGINKPVDSEKVANIAKGMKKPNHLIVVNQLNGIRPQTKGSSILMDGHHRLESYKVKGWTDTPVYSGTYTGADSSYTSTLNLPKFPKDRPMVFAFDFDDTIRAKSSGMLSDTVALIKKVRNLGHKAVIWTCRSGVSESDMISYLRANKVPYDHVNSNPGFETGSRKIFADIYIDDRAFNVSQVGDLLTVKFPEVK